MTRYAHNCSRIAATLLALSAACGSGRPAPGSKFSGIRMQDPAELDSENGLIAVGLSEACFSLGLAPTATDAAPATPYSTTTSTDPATGITYTTTTWTDPATGIAYTQKAWTDPLTFVAYTQTTWTDPLTGLAYAQTTSTDPLTGVPTTTTTAKDPLTGTVTDAPATPVVTVPAPAAAPATIDPNACGFWNGMSPNLLGIQGLHPNSLTDDHFKKWFAADPKTADALMKYLVKCSLPVGLGMDFEYGGIAYRWTGLLGMAPHWAAGESIPESEQQLVTACMGLHANRYGAHVPISVLGQFADGTPIPISGDELASFPVTEGCFFGNLFNKDGLFSGNDRPLALADDQSSIRACAMPDRTGAGASSMCAPIKYAGNCRDLCQPDPTNLSYLTCTVNGRSYRALSTRIQPSAQYTCGDGICQVTESCGTGTTWDNCGLDCGPCN
jgi:hypothetical protein